MAVRKGDTVVVLAGKDRGKRGKVERVEHTRRGLAVVVPGINMAKRHTKSKGGRSQTAGIIDLPMPLQISNVMVVCPACSRPTRIKHEQAADGRSVRVCIHCGEPVSRVEKKRK